MRGIEFNRHGMYGAITPGFAPPHNKHSVIPAYAGMTRKCGRSPADNIYTLNSTLFTLLFPRTRGNNKKRGNAPFLLHRQFFAMNVDNDCAALAHGTGQNQVGYFILDRGRN